MIRLAVLILVATFMSAAGHAHEVRPAYLEITEQSENVFQISWKQPVADGRRLALEPVLPVQCVQTSEPAARIVDGAVVTRWQATCGLREGLIAIDGLDRTLTDVFIQVTYLDGEVKRAVVRPGEEGLKLSEATAGAATSYLRLGIEHILSGPDHLLFVAGLLLLAPLRKLFFVITAFTLAHSLTLAATTFGWVSLSPAPVETMIAISILLLAVEAVRTMDGNPSLAAQWPWLLSFGFGLLHGFGFAGALGEIGLPAGAELAALFYFNIGVEIGQLLFIGMLLLAWFALNKLMGTREMKVQRFAAYVVGTCGAFWVLERLGTLFVV